MQTSTVTSKGQITIPVNLRKKVGIKPTDKVVFNQVNGQVFISKLASIDSLYGSLANPKVKPLSNKELDRLVRTKLFSQKYR